MVEVAQLSATTWESGVNLLALGETMGAAQQLLKFEPGKESSNQLDEAHVLGFALSHVLCVGWTITEHAQETGTSLNSSL